MGLTDATQLTAGYNRHVCALRATGQVACWGNNNFCSLGLGAQGGATPLPTPVLALGGAPLDGVEEVRMAGGGGCARRTDGTVWCWGDQESDGFHPTNQCFATQNVDVAAATNMSCGQFMCCAAAAGNGWCWTSSNSQGQVGDGLVGGGRHLPSRVLTGTGTLSGVVSVHAGLDFVCARLTDDSLTCWGSNFLGKAGQPGNSSQPFATPFTEF